MHQHTHQYHNTIRQQTHKILITDKLYINIYMSIGVICTTIFKTEIWKTSAGIYYIARFVWFVTYKNI